MLFIRCWKMSSEYVSILVFQQALPFNSYFMTVITFPFMKSYCQNEKEELYISDKLRPMP